MRRKGKRNRKRGIKGIEQNGKGFMEKARKKRHKKRTR